MKPNKKSKTGGAKGSVAIWKEFTQLGCVTQDSYPRKPILRELGRLGAKHAVNFSKGTWHQRGSIARYYQKCAPHERSPCAPKFEDTDHMRRP